MDKERKKGPLLLLVSPLLFRRFGWKLRKNRAYSTKHDLLAPKCIIRSFIHSFIRCYIVHGFPERRFVVVNVYVCVYVYMDYNSQLARSGLLGYAKAAIDVGHSFSQTTVVNVGVAAFHIST